MQTAKTVEYPPSLKKLYRKAYKIEFMSFLYMISAAIFSFVVMSNSQTMKTVWLEDTLGIIPPLSFLIASKIIHWKPTPKFPYGFHRAIGIAFLTSSLALLVLGIYLFIDGAVVLVKQERPNIPIIHLFGYSVWLGYLMIIALLWSSVPSTLLGHFKIPLAKKLYDKILYADSKMNKASWMSGFASIFGIIGIGFGYWWADATVGIIISFSIITDGYSNTKQAILDLIDQAPKTIDTNTTDPLINDVKKIISEEDWIKDFQIRFRDDGHVFFGEIFVEPKNKAISIDKISHLRNKIEKYHWRLSDIVIEPRKVEKGSSLDC